MALRTVVDKRGVEAGLDRCDHAARDLAAGQAALGDLDLEVLQDIVLDNRDAELLRYTGID